MRKKVEVHHNGRTDGYRSWWPVKVCPNGHRFRGCSWNSEAEARSYGERLASMPCHLCMKDGRHKEPTP